MRWLYTRFTVSGFVEQRKRAFPALVDGRTGLVTMPRELIFAFRFYDVDDDGFARKCDVVYQGEVILTVEKGGSEDAWDTIREFCMRWRARERDGKRENMGTFKETLDERRGSLGY